MGISIAIFVLILWYTRTSAKKQNMELAKTDIDNGSSSNRIKKNNIDKINYYVCLAGQNIMKKTVLRVVRE